MVFIFIALLIVLFAAVGVAFVASRRGSSKLTTYTARGREEVLPNVGDDSAEPRDTPRAAVTTVADLPPAANADLDEFGDVTDA
ncbi:MAG: hypothetical protein ACRYG2_02935, partial [Janthinobacterium lividum]